MRLPEEPDVSPQINIVPMIDVIFAVLVFFILSSLLLTQNQGLPVNLPTAASGETQLRRQVTVTIDPSGAVFLAQQPVAVEQISEVLKTLIPEGETSLVVIQADAAVSHGQVVAVMDQLRRLRGVQLAIATQSPADPQ